MCCPTGIRSQTTRQILTFPTKLYTEILLCPDKELFTNTMLFVIALFVCCLSSSLAERTKCHEDRHKYCPDLKHQELHRCMEEHIDQFSEECKASITVMKKKYEQVRIECASDEETFCASFRSNHKELKHCMKEYYDLLSPACKGAITALRAKPMHQEHHEEQENQERAPCPMEECAQDLNTLCSQVTTMEEAHKCLVFNLESLSEPCHSAIVAAIQTQGTNTGEEQMHDPVASRPHFWFIHLWWVYPTFLVLLIQFLACYKIRQIKKMEEEAL